jgi:hypothetical protein
MAISFVILFPSFALTLYLIPSSTTKKKKTTKKTVSRIHAPLQLATMCLVIAGLGLGAYIERAFGLMHENQPHPIIGVVVVVVLVVGQPVLGYLHHRAYVNKQKQKQRQHDHQNEEPTTTGKKSSGSSSLLGFSHRWLGRCALVLGIVNGGLGLRLTRTEMGDLGASRTLEIAYGVVAGMMGVVYVGVVVGSKFVKARRMRTVSAVDTDGRREGMGQGSAES